jgi:hypothetical protein
MQHFDIVSRISGDLTPDMAVAQFDADDWGLHTGEGGDYDSKYVAGGLDDEGPNLTFFFRGDSLVAARNYSCWSENEALAAANLWSLSITAAGAFEEPVSAF